MIESMVAILLLLTILYCVRLNRQLRLLKADEQSLRATIGELVTATEIAERAIGGLKAAMRDGEQTLGQQLTDGQSLSAELERQIGAGLDIVSKLSRITGATRPAEQAAADTQAVAAAAQAIAERARRRVSGLAA
jgi:hypothetical protein